MGNDKKLQSDDPLQSRKTSGPNSSQGSTVGPDGVVTLGEITIVGDPSDGSYDPPVQDDWWGNALVSIAASGPEAIVEGVLETGDKEAVGALVEEVGSIIWGIITTETPSVEDLPKEDDPKDAGTDGSTGNDDSNNGDEGDEGDEGSKGEGESGSYDDEGDGVGGGDSRGEKISILIARGLISGGIVPPHSDDDGDGTGRRSEELAIIIEGALASGAPQPSSGDGGDGDGTGENNMERVAALITAALVTGGIVAPPDDLGDGDGTGRPPPIIGFNP